MTALIYKALQQYVLDSRDSDTWDQIVGKAHATSRAETAFQRVNGSELGHLIAVAATTTEVDSAEMLEAAGKNWVMRNAEQVAERLSRINGASFAEAEARGLRQFHNGIGMVFPSLRPPVLLCQWRGDDQARFEFHWARESYGPFLLGLLAGLASCFDDRLTIQAIPGKPGPTHGPSTTEFVASLTVGAENAA